VKIVTVKLNKRGRRLLKAQHRLKVTVVVNVSTTNGLKQAVTKQVTPSRGARQAQIGARSPAVRQYSRSIRSDREGGNACYST
jgi:hypothetical protein